MKSDQTFSNLLKDIKNKIDEKNLRSGVISICSEIPLLNSLNNYNYLLMKYSFAALWQEEDDLSFIALDKCKYITLDGPNRFKIAKDFYNQNLKNLINIDQNSHPSSLSKIIYFFSFSDSFSRGENSVDVPNMEAILPKILIINNHKKSWIRMNVQFNHKKSIREIIEEFCLFRTEILSTEFQEEKKNINISITQFENAFNKSRKNLIKNISKGIELTQDNILKKIVLSSKIKIKLESKFYLNNILKKLKYSQDNSCIYVWKRNTDDITFGASPEKLFSLKNDQLILEAIAGTSEKKINQDFLLNNSKNIKEHTFVVNFLINSLKKLNIYKFQRSNLKVKNFGNIAHLQTILKSSVTKLCPFKVLSILHPSPAVCGIPQDLANEWIQTLETFSRGNYASPIGWIDIEGNADFRVAIRGARYVNKEIHLTAGAGLVKDSLCLEEVDEIKLKFESIAKQIFLTNIFQ